MRSRANGKEANNSTALLINASFFESTIFRLKSLPISLPLFSLFLSFCCLQFLFCYFAIFWSFPVFVVAYIYLFSLFSVSHVLLFLEDSYFLLFPIFRIPIFIPQFFFFIIFGHTFVMFLI